MAMTAAQRRAYIEEMNRRNAAANAAIIAANGGMGAILGGGGGGGDEDTRAAIREDGPDEVEAAGNRAARIRRRRKREARRAVRQMVRAEMDEEDEGKIKRLRQEANDAMLRAGISEGNAYDANRPGEKFPTQKEFTDRIRRQEEAQRAAAAENQVQAAKVQAAQAKSAGVDPKTGEDRDIRGQQIRDALLESALAGKMPTAPDFFAEAMGYEDSAAILAKVYDEETEFYDKKGSRINPKTGQPYTYFDFMESQESNPGSIIPDIETMAGPFFMQRSQDPNAKPVYGQTVPVDEASGTFAWNYNSDAARDEKMSVYEFYERIAESQRNGDELLPWLQRLMWEAGLYDSVDSMYEVSYDPESEKFTTEPVYGILDEATIEALGNLTAVAYRTMAQGETRTVPELLNGMRDARLQKLGWGSFDEGLASRGGGGGGGGGGGADLIPVSDPVAMAQLADQIGQEVYGRRLNPAERDEVLAVIRDLEVGEGNARSAGGIYEQIDVEARVRQALRLRSPQEAQAHDVAGAFNMFANILQNGFFSGSFGSSDVPVAGGAGVLGGPLGGM